MKIVCVIRSLCLGGAERQLSGLAVGLQMLGHDVEVLTYLPGDFYADQLRKAGVKHIYLPRSHGNGRLVREMAGHFRRTKAELVIAFMTGPALKCCAAKKYHPDFRLIVSERNVNRWALPHDLYRFLRFRRADAIVCNSHAQERFVRRHFAFCADKLHTIVNFTDTERFHPPAEPAGSTRPLILTTARVSARKNLHGAIRAAAFLRDRFQQDFRWQWFGVDGESRYLQRCRRLLERKGLTGHFDILPATREVDALYREASLFCLPSFYEGTPNSLCEALASGLPAAVSDVSDNARYVQDGINGTRFKLPLRAKAMAASLDTLLRTGSSRLADYRHNSRRIAESAFSFATFREAWGRLAEEIRNNES